MFNIISNLWNIIELRNRILNTIYYISIYRLGSYIVLPGMDPLLYKSQNTNSYIGIFNMINMFVGDALEHFSIFSLGIMPYISASILMQLMTFFVPFFKKIQRDGIYGYNQINQWIRIITLVMSIIQGIIFIKFQMPSAIIAEKGTCFILYSIILLSSGTMFIMWLSEKITLKGIGNGISIIIMTGIIIKFPYALFYEIKSKIASYYFFPIILFELILFTLIMFFIITITQITRKIPVEYVSNIGYNNLSKNYIPLKINSSGIMPIIFAQFIMFCISLISGFLNQNRNVFDNYNSILYNVMFSVLIILFSYCYTIFIINPNNISENIKKNGGYIPNINPGIETSIYIDTILKKITLIGSLFLATIAIIPSFIINFNITNIFAQFYGGTSLIIIISSILEIIEQSKSYLIVHYYNNLIYKTNKI
ncbi:MAG: preprotein translocase subunit SecY [Bacteroides sp.]|nr:MAG: preprotein translocase subunit SecY [Bacteroides sp.]